jgi:hypothetical protein
MTASTVKSWRDDGLASVFGLRRSDSGEFEIFFGPARNRGRTIFGHAACSAARSRLLQFRDLEEPEATDLHRPRKLWVALEQALQPHVTSSAVSLAVDLWSGEVDAARPGFLNFSL